MNGVVVAVTQTQATCPLWMVPLTFVPLLCRSRAAIHPIHHRFFSTVSTALLGTLLASTSRPSSAFCPTFGVRFPLQASRNRLAGIPLSMLFSNTLWPRNFVGKHGSCTSEVNYPALQITNIESFIYFSLTSAWPATYHILLERNSYKAKQIYERADSFGAFFQLQVPSATENKHCRWGWAVVWTVCLSRCHAISMLEALK